MLNYKTLNLILIAIIMIFGCTHKHDSDFIKLSMSPKEALGKSTILFPPNNKIIINNNYNGVTEHPILSGEIIKTRYYTHPEHIAETDKYIFTIIAYNSGGTGTFYYLTVIDKKNSN